MHLSLPGSQPFLRGRLAGGYLTSPWLIAQECEQADTESFNQNLKNELSRGTTAVHICLDTPTLLGNNPDEAETSASACDKFFRQDNDKSCRWRNRHQRSYERKLGWGNGGGPPDGRNTAAGSIPAAGAQVMISFWWRPLVSDKVK